MQSVWVSLVALLAAASIAAPVDTFQRRQLPGIGGVASPLTTVLSEVGKQAPSAVNKATEAVNEKKAVPQAAPQAMNDSKMNSTAKAAPKSKDASGGPLDILGSLTGGLGL